MNAISRRTSSIRLGLSLLLSQIVVFGIFIALSTLDFPFIQFVRSLHHPLLEQIGNVGNWLGDGVTLVGISIGLFAIGYVWKRDAFKGAGLDSLIAHAVIGVVVQIPKHLIGRPRPRLMHQHPFEMGPSFQGGFDAFPSGHSSASFAVAAVLAKYFPHMTWVWYGTAAFVGISRVMRGSHFPTDVMAGAMLGLLVGYVLARPLQTWKQTSLHVILNSLPFFVTGFALLWVMVQGEPLQNTMRFLSVILGGRPLLLGVWIQRECRRSKPISFWSLKKIGAPEARLIVGMGLALSTGSWLIITLAGLAGMVWWMMQSQISMKESEVSRVHDLVRMCGLVGLFLLIQQIHSLLPLL